MLPSVACERSKSRLIKLGAGFIWAAEAVWDGCSQVAFRKPSNRWTGKRYRMSHGIVHHVSDIHKFNTGTFVYSLYLEAVISTKLQISGSWLWQRTRLGSGQRCRTSALVRAREAVVARGRGWDIV